MSGASPFSDTASGTLASSEDHATLDAALAFVDAYDLADLEPALLPGGHAADSSPLVLMDALGGETIIDALSLIEQQHSHPPIMETTETTEMKPSSSTTEDPTTESGKRTTTNRSRTRQKDELVYLRGVVEELEAQMSTLKKGGDAMAGGTKTEEPLAFVWEELAARQYAQRQRAEVENVKLKTMLDEQIRVAKNLERVLKKRTMAEFLVPSAAKRIRKYKQSSAIDDPSVYDELMLTVDEMYTQVDAVFADERYTRMSPALREIQARNDDELGTIVEVFDSRVGPFEMDKISDAVWHHMASQAFDPNAFHDEVVELTDTMFKREFGSTIDLPRFKGTFHAKLVARRIVEDDRVLVLWAALVDPEKIADTPMDGLVMRQRGWTLLRHPPPGLVRSGRPATVTQLYHMVIPEIDEDLEGDQRRKVGTLTNFVLGSVDFHLEMGRQMIENLLFEAAWKTPASTTSNPSPEPTISMVSD